MQSKRVLITGGLGFIGSRIATQYISMGWHVEIVDALITNVCTPEEFRRLDVPVHVKRVDEYLAAHPLSTFDYVVHAASYVGSAGVLSHSGRIAAETLATLNRIADFCMNSGARLLFISSSEVYGRNGALAEDMDIRVPPISNARIEYALAKLTSEVVLSNLREVGLQSVCIRPFNVVGERQSRFGGFVLPTFVQQAIANEPVTVYGDGSQSRAFTSVDDLASFVTSHLDDTAYARGGVYNIGNPSNECSISALASLVVARLGSTSTIKLTDPRSVHGPMYAEAESHIKHCDVSKARTLGWHPEIDLVSIIDQAAFYYQHHLDMRGSDARQQYLLRRRSRSAC